jgi:hypothetical protein
VTDSQLSLRMTEATTPADPDAQSQMLAPPAGWPEPPTAEAYHGVFGAIIEKLAPNTEADRATRGRTLRVNAHDWRIG